MYLPEPSKLMTEENPWFTGADITNFPVDSENSKIPLAEPNPFDASDTFYDLLREFQKATLHSVDYEYPFTEDVILSDGRKYKLEFKKKIEAFQNIPETEQAGRIEGVTWCRHHVVWGDSSAGYSALVDPAPFQVIDHGEGKYDNDAYGIHLTSEDRLTFLGDERHGVAVRLLDCRRESPTFHEEEEIGFNPSPLRYLCIPAGVAHGFRHLENVFTVNRPRKCAGDLTQFEPGNDVIDWHFNDYPAPSFEIEQVDVPVEYYKELARRQRKYIEADEKKSTAMVFLASNERGQKVRVALRKT